MRIGGGRVAYEPLNEVYLCREKEDTIVIMYFVRWKHLEEHLGFVRLIDEAEATADWLLNLVKIKLLCSLTPSCFIIIFGFFNTNNILSLLSSLRY